MLADRNPFVLIAAAIFSSALSFDSLGGDVRQRSSGSLQGIAVTPSSLLLAVKSVQLTLAATADGLHIPLKLQEPQTTQCWQQTADVPVTEPRPGFR